MKRYMYLVAGILLVALGVGGMYLSSPGNWGPGNGGGRYDGRGRNYLRPGPNGRGNQWWGPMMGPAGRGGWGGPGARGMMGYGPNRQGLPASFSSNGQRIFLTGTSQSGNPITARIGYMQTANGATSCANCHLEDARGGSWRTAMGSFRVPNITYPVLTSRQEHEEGGRKHPPYTEATIKRAITQGVDPAGQPLQPPMPRWSMSSKDLNDLVQYLKNLR